VTLDVSCLFATSVLCYVSCIKYPMIPTTCYALFRHFWDKCVNYLFQIKICKEILGFASEFVFICYLICLLALCRYGILICNMAIGGIARIAQWHIVGMRIVFDFGTFMAQFSIVYICI